MKKLAGGPENYFKVLEQEGVTKPKPFKEPRKRMNNPKNGSIQYHPASLKMSETEMNRAIISGHRWVSSLAPDGMECRTLIPINGCTIELDPAEPSAPIFQPVAIEALDL